jgi:membrane-associated phospholipid phosphatase
MTVEFWRAVTQLGDTAVILPLAALMTGILWLYESRHCAWLLMRSMLACLAVMGTLKMVFISCGQDLGIDIESPSGHTSIATYFYGSLGMMARAWYRPALGWAAMLLAAAVILLVAASRVILGFHSVPEVIVGMVVGVGCLGWFAVPYLRAHPLKIRFGKIAVVLLPALLLTYGLALPVEKVLRSFSPYFRAMVCPP